MCEGVSGHGQIGIFMFRDGWAW